MTTRTLDGIVLRYGKHASPDAGMCAMEAAAWLAGEPHSDSPQCVCPVIASFLRQRNDRLRTDEERTAELAPLLPRILGSRSTRDVEQRRAFACADWAVREVAPIALRKAGRVAGAERLAALPPIVDAATARASAATSAYADAAAAAAADAAYAATSAAYAAAAAAAADAYAAYAATSAAYAAAAVSAADAAAYAADAAYATPAMCADLIGRLLAIREPTVNQEKPDKAVRGSTRRRAPSKRTPGKKVDPS